MVVLLVVLLVLVLVLVVLVLLLSESLSLSSLSARFRLNALAVTCTWWAVRLLFFCAGGKGQGVSQGVFIFFVRYVCISVRGGGRYATCSRTTGMMMPWETPDEKCSRVQLWIKNGLLVASAG